MWPGDAFGSFILAVTPWWNSADLADGEEKVFWHCNHGEDYSGSILYKKGTGFIFRRVTDGNAYEAVRSVSGAALPTRDVQQKLTVRWVADGGELGMLPYSHQIAVDGVWGTTAVIEDPMVLEPTATVYVGSNGDDSWGDAFLAHADVSPLVLTDEELERRAP